MLNMKIRVLRGTPYDDTKKLLDFNLAAFLQMNITRFKDG